MATADDFVAAGCAPAPIAAALARGAPAPEIDFQQRPHAGPYQLLARLGRGGMAELFLAQRRGPGGFRKLVAVKRILPHLADDALFADMFVNEGRIAAQLQHPNLCQVYELGADGSNLYMAMEFLDGVSLQTFLQSLPRDHSGQHLRLLATILQQCAAGLAYAHGHSDPVTGTPTPIVHRDISPHNIMVTRDGTVKVLDFGVAKILTETTRTQSGMVKGKLAYMAPEQALAQPLDQRVDVFALGIVMWEAVTGAPLFRRATDFLVWQAVSECLVPAASAFAVCAPPGLDNVLFRALNRNLSARTQTATQFADEFAHVVTSAPKLRTVATQQELANAVARYCAAELAANSALYNDAVQRARQCDAAHPFDMRALAPAKTTAVRPVGCHESERSQPCVASPSNYPTAEFGAYAAWFTESASADLPQHGAEDTLPRMPQGLLLAAVRRAQQNWNRPRWRRTLQLVAVASLGIFGLHAGARLAREAGAGHAQHQNATAPTHPLQLDEQRVNRPPTMPPTTADLRASIGTADSLAPRLAPSPQVHHNVPPVSAAASLQDNPRRLPPQAQIISPQPHRSNAAAGIGYLSIDSSPFATVYLDGRTIGETPLYRTRIAAGVHRLKAVTASGRMHRITVHIKPNEHFVYGTLRW